MCNHENNDVISTRKNSSNPHLIRRRRVCSNCGYRWTTYEVEAEFFEGVSTRKLAESINLKHQLDECKQSLENLTEALSSLTPSS